MTWGSAAMASSSMHIAAEAKQVLDEAIHGSMFETHSPVESYSLLYLNAPLSERFFPYV